VSRLPIWLAVVCALAAPRAGLAHAVPVAMSPDANAAVAESPREVTIRFSERVEPRASSLKLLDARGKPVAGVAPRVDPGDPWLYRLALPPLPPGPYTVAWRVLSADDGHVTEGAYGLAVGTATAPAAPPASTAAPTSKLAAAGRWVTTLAALLLLGTLVGPTIFGHTGRSAPTWLRLTLVAAMAAGEVASFAARAWQLAPGPGLPAAATALSSTAVGRVAGWRLALLALLTALFGGEALGPWRGPWLRLAAAATALAVLGLGGLVTHSAAVVTGSGLAVAAELCHLVGAALWLAGLAYFATLFWASFRPAAAELARAIPAFSVVATLGVGSLTLSGLYLARLHLGAVGDLAATAYGRLLLAKLALVAAMLGLGAYHQLRVHPRAAAVAARSWEDREAVARAFRRSLRLEAGLGVLVLLLAALLGATPPSPPTAPTAVFRHERHVDDARVLVEISPLRPGPNTIRVAATDHQGRPLSTVRAALVQLVPSHDHVGPVALALTPSAPGTFVSSGALLGMEGAWKGRLVLQREGAYDVNERFEVVLSGAPAAPRPAAPLDWPMAAAALAIATTTVVLVLCSRRALSRAPAPTDALDPHPGPPAGQEAVR
jgi:copper transport protein